MQQDSEYAVCYKDSNGVTEERLKATNLDDAKEEAMWYVKRLADEITIKFYEEGDLRHQWDYIGKNGLSAWSQYE